ncbi:MAG: hypothetical protein A2Y82_04025 [Candidatus Buchananbacteria bacterium RBG_13_36_9]|uniref:Uncharacterized protein n=1 Tax=Candidatus Buchananbacteria bacterium RBG_13_36_9 TaxID=1797530 RepID=A0A1G1XT69_9BACT|nr:MAG: hypothetical protein A2Y82_04025 [Candidatus Buchananbacteria bacterium RBG_13_36_9]
MKKTILIIAIIIIAIVIIAIFALNLIGYWPFLNKPISYLVAGPVDKFCQTDSDCQIKPTQCAYCDCGDAVNINWKQNCPFKTHYISYSCKLCPGLQAKCVANQCQRNIIELVSDFKSCAAAGYPVTENYPRQCRANGQTFTEVLEPINCSQSIECELPMAYAVKSNCPYQAYCVNNGCWVGCPMYRAETKTYQVKCLFDSDCDCSSWDINKTSECACVDNQCISLQEEIIEGNPVIDTSSRMDLEAIGYECPDQNGKWLYQYRECENISQTWCSNEGGTFNECASACRHNPKAEVCTLQCVPVCQFE